MNNHIFCFVQMASIPLKCQHVFWQPDVRPAVLNEFWSGIDIAWMPPKENAIWADEQRDVVRKYCKKFAKSHKQQNLVPAMIEDLARRPSEVNAFIYIWVALNWNGKEVKAILKPFYDGNDSLKKQIASDFIAEIEEAEESITGSVPDN
jgi:hypothetical protein